MCVTPHCNFYLLCDHRTIRHMYMKQLTVHMDMVCHDCVPSEKDVPCGKRYVRSRDKLSVHGFFIVSTVCESKGLC